VTSRPNLLLLTALVLMAPFLAACPSLPTIEVPKTVNVEVPVPCIPAGRAPAKPATRSAEELDAMDDYHYTLATRSELEKYWGYVPQLEALIDGCSRLPAKGEP
jgi:hypothetical protein